MNSDSVGTTGTAACPNCGSANSPGFSFCEKCGAGLAGAEAGAAAGVPTVAPPITPMYAPPQPQYPPQQQVMIRHAVVGPANNGLCVAALVLGIIAAVFFWAPFFGIVLGILATVFGAIGIPSAAKKGQAGRAMGIAGLVLGIIALGLNILFIIVVWGIFSSTTHYYYYNNSFIRPVLAGLAALV